MSYRVTSKSSKVGFIVQLPIVCTDRMQSAQEMILSKNCWISTYDDRPGKLFDGLEHIRATIFITDNTTITYQHSTRYHRWNTKFRNSLFQEVKYIDIIKTNKINAIPKLGGILFKTIYTKLLKLKAITINIASNMNKHSVF